MKKNVASQVIGAQLIAKADGSPVTAGATTVYVTGDGGSQAAGSVGSGACTHEGNGFWTYTPSQAETNFDHVAFTFVNSLAINATVQAYPSFPQTGDAFADTTNIKTRIPAALVSGRIDASVGAMEANTVTASALATDAAAEIQSGLATASSLGTGIGTILSAVDTVDNFLDTEIAAIKAKTDNLPADPTSTTTMSVFFSNIAAYIDTEVAAIKAKTDNLPSDPADASVVAGLIAAVETKVDDLPTNAELATALGAADDAVLAQVALVKAKTDALPSDPADASVIAGLIAAVETKVDDLPTNAELATALGAADDAILAQVALVKAKTDALPSDPADQSIIIAATDLIRGDIAIVDGVVDAIKVKTDNLPAAPAAAGDIPTANQNADALLDRANGVETGWSLRHALRIVLSALGGKAAGLATSTATLRDVNDTKARITATVDQDGNRSAVTLDAS